MINNPTDSRELAQMRVRFRTAHPRLTATPERLGKYARDTGTTITDYGAHSKRWIELFNRGNRGDGPIRYQEPTHFAPSPLEIFKA